MSPHRSYFFFNFLIYLFDIVHTMCVFMSSLEIKMKTIFIYAIFMYIFLTHQYLDDLLWVQTHHRVSVHFH